MTPAKVTFFEKKIDKTQMSKPPECAATFSKNFSSIYVGHLGLQSVRYRVTNPVISPDQNFEKTLATQGLGERIA